MLTSPTSHKIHFDGVDREIHITPVIQHLPGGDMYYATGVYKLHEGSVGLGELVFDDDFDKWEYTGIGDLTHEETWQLVHFIKAAKMS
jgi:hypothetical protein